ncbi:hypothetical protein LWI28_020657 [Acer negundo]|uniref:Dof-type domain-containing protein n=1 Tax=Acer negundo TaxID=4023 RepID=A0AAD5NWJ4_ACENE|nr:hypothetical protein LWI28_005645 [Acer negundo]KAI9186766.1 hypothetical protein LWI28_020657 [Acer negundo]KAK4851833.1 hypothetical protein QYF36_018778 [Acer negundo]
MNGGDMSDFNKDSGIKLFGAKIPVPDIQIPARPEYMDAETEGSKLEDRHGEPVKLSTFDNVKEEDQTPVEANEAQVNTKANQAETNSDQEKVFKRPDKIVPCPRCNSLETKFCYFNNYNVNQPRHFCKNCQRYWTAGGTMRNVPVGAGRRKNKHFASQFRQIILSADGVPITTLESPNSATHQLISCGDSATTFRPSVGNGTVLKFGPEVPLCESMETVLNLGDHKRSIDVGTMNRGENREEPTSSGSSLTASGIQGNDVPENVMQKEQVVLQGSCNELNTPHPAHCYPSPPWNVPWHPGWNTVTPMAAASQYPSDRVCVPNSSNLNPVQWCPTPVLAVPGFCPPNIPLQFVPASYWNCMSLWAAGAGNMSLTRPNGCSSPSSSTSNNSCCSGNGLPILGKHSRDPNFMEEEQTEQCILVPKTLRIDDPDEASKSSIWATLGIKHDQKDSIPRGTIFKGLETKKQGKGRHVLDGTQILEANPAALSRSHTFQEST